MLTIHSDRARQPVVMRTLAAVAIIGGVAAGVATPASARSGDEIRFGQATVSGEDCTRDGPAEPIYDIPNKRFSVTFSNFEAAAVHQGDITNAVCEVMVPVFLASGFRLRVTDTIFAGKTTMGRTDTARLLGEVRFHGLSHAPVYRVDKRYADHAGVLKAFVERGQVEADYNTCRETQVVVSIHTQIQSENHGGEDATIQLDSIEHTLAGAINVNLMTERC